MHLACRYAKTITLKYATHSKRVSGLNYFEGFSSKRELYGFLDLLSQKWD
jgi:hypothetical protein